MWIFSGQLRRRASTKNTEIEKLYDADTAFPRFNCVSPKQQAEYSNHPRSYLSCKNVGIVVLVIATFMVSTQLGSMTTTMQQSDGRELLGATGTVKTPPEFKPREEFSEPREQVWASSPCAKSRYNFDTAAWTNQGDSAGWGDCLSHLSDPGLENHHADVNRVFLHTCNAQDQKVARTSIAMELGTETRPDTTGAKLYVLKESYLKKITVASTPETAWTVNHPFRTMCPALTKCVPSQKHFMTNGQTTQTELAETCYQAICALSEPDAKIQAKKEMLADSITVNCD